MNEHNQKSFDDALSHRLAKLSTMPVDTTRLDRALRAQIGAPNAADTSVGRPTKSWQRSLRPLVAVAASLVVIAIVSLALLQNRPVRADALVQLHNDIVGGKIPSVQVASIDDVNKAFNAFQCGAPMMTASGDVQPRCCCVGKLGNKKVPCIMLNGDKVPVTMALVDAGDVKLAGATTMTHNGETFHITSHGGMNLVVVERNNHAVCIVGALPTDQLIALADQVKF